jgi:hypothetical protein
VEEALFSAQRDIESRQWWFRGRRHAIVELGPFLATHGIVAHVGCGTGAAIAALPASCRRHGLDTSPTATAFAQESYPDVEFDVGAVPHAGDAAAPRTWWCSSSGQSRAQAKFCR